MKWEYQKKLTIDALGGTDLVLPLPRHDLGIGSGDVNVGIQARLVVSLYNITPKRLAGSVTTVVRSLRSREAVLGPAKRPSHFIQHGVFLLQAEPGLMLLVLFHEHGGVVAEVVLVGLAV